tara:strand:+ start:514 stop:693 length:180 start_codon:yes stop_codon:yes gene_type:complete
MEEFNTTFPVIILGGAEAYIHAGIDYIHDRLVKVVNIDRVEISAEAKGGISDRAKISNT